MRKTNADSVGSPAKGNQADQHQNQEIYQRDLQETQGCQQQG